MNDQRPSDAMILPSGSSVGVHLVRQFGDFPIRRGVALDLFCRLIVTGRTAAL